MNNENKKIYELNTGEVWNKIKETKCINSANEMRRLLALIAVSKHALFFRGQSQYDWHFESSHYRENREAGRGKMIEYFENIFEAAKKNSLIANEIDTLSHLQHNKHLNSPLIDITQDIYIALFFASNEFFDKDGSLYIIRDYDYRASPKIHRKKIMWSEENPIIYKGGHGLRSIAQKSFFCLDNVDWYDNFSCTEYPFPEINKIRISASVKYQIRELLQKKGINFQYIFPDSMGDILELSKKIKK